MLIFIALPRKFFKTHIFRLYNIPEKSGMLQSPPPPHENLVLEIKGFLVFRKGKRSLTQSVPQVIHADRGFLFVHICVLYFLLVFWAGIWSSH